MKVNWCAALFLILIVTLSSCSSSNIEQKKSWGKYFENNGITGCFMFHNPADSKFEVYNLGQAQARYLPAGTFMIMNAMVGLETGVISDTNMLLNKDRSKMTMGAAFRSSYVPYFQEIARRIGSAKMQYWIDSVYYGNKKMESGIDSFWLNNTLKISPDEQLGLVERLYYGKLPFQSRTQRLVKNLMLKKKAHDYSLYYKAGFGQAENKQIGWVVGWVKKNDHPFSFVLLTKAPDSLENFSGISMKVLNSLLKNLNFEVQISK